LTLTQAFNSLGTTIAPLFGAYLILSTAALTADQLAVLPPDQQTAYRIAEAASVQVPYLGLAAALLVIAGIIAMVKLPAVEAATDMSATGDAYDTMHPSAWRYRHLILGAIGIFVYVGAEVSIGSFLVNFMGESDIAGLPAEEAGRYLSFYWGGAMVGRFIGAGLMRRIKPGTILGFNGLMAGALVLAAMLFSGHLSMWALLAVGLFNSIMFPTIFSLGVEKLGRHTGQGSGILCMAIVGGALLPVIQGYFADTIGIHHAFFLPVLCYLYIAYYGFRGHEPVVMRARQSA
jgi:FHS family L-fucose permease-like MFS transporter